MAPRVQPPSSTAAEHASQPPTQPEPQPTSIIFAEPALQPGVTEEDITTIRSVAESMAQGQKLQHLLPPGEVTRLRDVAERHIPRTIREAVDVIDLLGFTQAQYRKAVKLLNVQHAADQRNVIMREILASKMVQRGLWLKLLFECIHDWDIDNPSMATEYHRMVRNLPPTGIKGRKFNLPGNRLYWLDGDIPLYTEDGRIVPGQPPLPEEDTTNQPLPEADNVEVEEIVQTDDRAEEYSIPEFEDSEYCRLLHALADKKMEKYLHQLMDEDLKDKLWVDRVAPIFNDPTFQPKPVRSLSGGVSKNDIKNLQPNFVRIRDGETLQNKFAEFKSLYRAAVRSYVQFGNDDTDTFSDFCQGRQYVMYAFCLLENYPKLEPITLKNPSSEKAAPTGMGMQRVPQKRSAPVEEIDVDTEVPSSPTPKRVKAAILQGPERAELMKIIKGAEPGEVVANHGLAGITSSPVEGLTKSEVVQQVERAEREKENMEHLMAHRMIDGRAERQGPSLVISQPRSAALEEIEGYARERAIIETRNARVNYMSSLLVAIREVNRAIEETKRDNQERRLFVDVRDNLLQSLSHSAVQDLG